MKQELKIFDATVYHLHFIFYETTSLSPISFSTRLNSKQNKTKQDVKNIKNHVVVIMNINGSVYMYRLHANLQIK